MNISQKQKSIECADGIIDYINEQIIMERVRDEFGSYSLEIANEVYKQIKIRM